MRTFSNSGNELLLAFGKRFNSLQGFFPADLFTLGAFDFYFWIYSSHNHSSGGLCRKRRELCKKGTVKDERAGSLKIAPNNLFHLTAARLRFC